LYFQSRDRCAPTSLPQRKSQSNLDTARLSSDSNISSLSLAKVHSLNMANMAALNNLELLKLGNSNACSYEDLVGHLTSDNEKDDTDTDSETEDTDEEQPITFK
jgi:hypothetical protein